MNNSDFQGLSSLLDLPEAAPPSTEELREFWGQALESRLRAFPEELGPSLKADLDEGPTFADVLFGARADLDDLKRARALAKSARAERDDLVPKEIATALYYCALAAERLLLDGQRPQTRLNDEQLVQGLEWLAEREWVDDRSRDLARRFLVQVGQAPAGP